MIKIGFWRGSKNETSELPWPTDYYDPHWDEEEREAVATYLDSGKIADSYRGWSECRVCGCMNGTSDMTDGTYLWPEGLSHYVREHNIRLPREFINHAMEGAHAIEVVKRAYEKWAQKKTPQLEELEGVEDDRVEMTTVNAEPTPELTKDTEKYMAWQYRPEPARKDAVTPKITQAQESLETKVSYLNKVFGTQIGNGLVPEWDSLTFDQKADKIRELMRKRRGYSKYDKRDIT